MSGLYFMNISAIAAAVDCVYFFFIIFLQSENYLTFIWMAKNICNCLILGSWVSHTDFCLGAAISLGFV